MLTFLQQDHLAPELSQTPPGAAGSAARGRLGDCEFSQRSPQLQSSVCSPCTTLPVSASSVSGSPYDTSVLYGDLGSGASAMPKTQDGSFGSDATPYRNGAALSFFCGDSQRMGSPVAECASYGNNGQGSALALADAGRRRGQGEDDVFCSSVSKPAAKHGKSSPSGSDTKGAELGRTVPFQERHDQPPPSSPTSIPLAMMTPRTSGGRVESAGSLSSVPTMFGHCGSLPSPHLSSEDANGALGGPALGRGRPPDATSSLTQTVANTKRASSTQPLSSLAPPLSEGSPEPASVCDPFSNFSKFLQGQHNTVAGLASSHFFGGGRGTGNLQGVLSGVSNITTCHGLLPPLLNICENSLLLPSESMAGGVNASYCVFAREDGTGASSPLQREARSGVVFQPTPVNALRSSSASHPTRTEALSERQGISHESPLHQRQSPSRPPRPSPDQQSPPASQRSDAANGLLFAPGDYQYNPVSASRSTVLPSSSLPVLSFSMGSPARELPVEGRRSGYSSGGLPAPPTSPADSSSDFVRATNASAPESDSRNGHCTEQGETIRKNIPEKSDSQRSRNTRSALELGHLDEAQASTRTREGLSVSTTHSSSMITPMPSAGAFNQLFLESSAKDLTQSNQGGAIAEPSNGTSDTATLAIVGGPPAGGATNTGLFLRHDAETASRGSAASAPMARALSPDFSLCLAAMTSGYTLRPVANLFSSPPATPTELVFGATCLSCGEGQHDNLGHLLSCVTPLCRRSFCTRCLFNAKSTGVALIHPKSHLCAICEYQSVKRPSHTVQQWHWTFTDHEDLLFTRTLRDSLPAVPGLFLEIHAMRQACWRRRIGGIRKHYSFKQHGGFFEGRLQAIQICLGHSASSPGQESGTTPDGAQLGNGHYAPLNQQDSLAAATLAASQYSQAMYPSSPPKGSTGGLDTGSCGLTCSVDTENFQQHQHQQQQLAEQRSVATGGAFNLARFATFNWVNENLSHCHGGATPALPFAGFDASLTSSTSAPRSSSLCSSSLMRTPASSSSSASSSPSCLSSPGDSPPRPTQLSCLPGAEVGSIQKRAASLSIRVASHDGQALGQTLTLRELTPISFASPLGSVVRLERGMSTPAHPTREERRLTARTTTETTPTTEDNNHTTSPALGSATGSPQSAVGSSPIAPSVALRSGEGGARCAGFRPKRCSAELSSSQSDAGLFSPEKSDLHASGEPHTRKRKTLDNLVQYAEENSSLLQEHSSPSHSVDGYSPPASFCGVQRLSHQRVSVGCSESGRSPGIFQPGTNVSGHNLHGSRTRGGSGHDLLLPQQPSPQPTPHLMLALASSSAASSPELESIVDCHGFPWGGGTASVGFSPRLTPQHYRMGEEQLMQQSFTSLERGGHSAADASYASTAPDTPATEHNKGCRMASLEDSNQKQEKGENLYLSARSKREGSLRLAPDQQRNLEKTESVAATTAISTPEAEVGGGSNEATLPVLAPFSPQRQCHHMKPSTALTSCNCRRLSSCSLESSQLVSNWTAVGDYKGENGGCLFTDTVPAGSHACFDMARYSSDDARLSRCPISGTEPECTKLSTEKCRASLAFPSHPQSAGSRCTKPQKPNRASPDRHYLNDGTTSPKNHHLNNRQQQQEESFGQRGCDTLSRCSSPNSSECHCQDSNSCLKEKYWCTTAAMNSAGFRDLPEREVLSSTPSRIIGRGSGGTRNSADGGITCPPPFSHFGAVNVFSDELVQRWMQLDLCALWNVKCGTVALTVRAAHRAVLEQLFSPFLQVRDDSSSEAGKSFSAGKDEEYNLARGVDLARTRLSLSHQSRSITAFSDGVLAKIPLLSGNEDEPRCAICCTFVTSQVDQNGTAFDVAYTCRFDSCSRVFCKACVLQSLGYGIPHFDVRSGSCALCAFQHALATSRRRTLAPSNWHVDFSSVEQRAFLGEYVKNIPAIPHVWFNESELEWHAGPMRASLSARGGFYEARWEATQLAVKDTLLGRFCTGDIIKKNTCCSRQCPL